MIDLHYWPTANGWKISIMLEECGLSYRTLPVNIARGEQFAPTFVDISPNSRIPAIVDHTPTGGGEPIAVFESGAILIYLAEKTGHLLAPALRERKAVIEWTMWQIGGLGPMVGQYGHFILHAPETLPYAITRYRREAHRLFRVLETQLDKTESYLAGEYSIADIACFPWMYWATTHSAYQLALGDYPKIERWIEAVGTRPAVRRGLAVSANLELTDLDIEARSHLFGGHEN